MMFAITLTVIFFFPDKGSREFDFDSPILERGFCSQERF
ncbi:hypothetical protein LEP1GSC188_3062 [Leptospira weilii serovar Topaz str. LT2116]|uniref:Uncharacterized protein n=1 Tax=Leptospira weilii serovar Topaz str. LT2116 TaxID=1088540 RepID=M3GAL6_9LEPT|nr:hypothetical protein LEP1GSC188_3062 [Leptospira weilii serovar Topaz str. LT2116]